MMKKIFCTILLALMTLFSFGQNKGANNQPLIQKKFLGVQFGDSPGRVYQRIGRSHPLKESDGYIITDQYFAGTNWHFVKMGFVDELLYIVKFQQEFKNEDYARKLFENVHRMLQVKYGDMEMTESEDGFTFTDAEGNKVSITVHLGPSKGGEDFWYCDLTYYWGEGLRLSYLKTINEL